MPKGPAHDPLPAASCALRGTTQTAREINSFMISFVPP